MPARLSKAANLRALTQSIFAGNAVARSRDESGSSMIEIALCLPVLLTIVLGITTFGIAINNYLLITDATNVSARQLAIARGQTLDPCGYVSSAAYTAAPTLTKANFTFAVTLNGTKYTGANCASSSATTGAPANMVQGTPAIVTITYPCALTVYNTNYAPSGCKLTAQTTELIQ